MPSLNSDGIEQLRKLGIANLGDLLAFPPFRYARYVRGAADHLLRKDEVLAYLDVSAHTKEPHEMLALPVASLKDVDSKSAALLEKLGIKSIADLAEFTAFAEAEDLIAPALDDETDPTTPSCVLPGCKKFSRNSKSFVSFFRQEEIRNLSVLSGGDKNTSGGVSTIAQLFNFRDDKDTKLIYLGYSVSYLQEWIFCGIHLGEPQGSVNLFMGQDTQVSILDFRRAISASRNEGTRVGERLASTIFHQRGVDEVARATAEEHQHGSTAVFAANAATAGSFVAAGAVIGGVGGGISGALTGLSVDTLTGGATGGLGTLSGAAVGTAVGSIAGSAAGSLIFSGATTLGFVETDAEGDREIFASSAQNIQQRTVQNSSSLRSFWSSIINQNVQEEQQQIRTDRVTNHNRIHALNALYFEVLNEYQVNIRANDFAPILFLPYKPIYFTREILRLYWWLIRTVIHDRNLVLALDQLFLSLNTDPSAAAELQDPPAIADVRSILIEVEVNLDGSAMEALITAPLTLPITDAIGRENVKVSVVTSAGTISLLRENSPNADPNFVGRYSTIIPIALHEITGIKIFNSNSEFRISGPFGILALNTLAFETIAATVTILDRRGLDAALPNLRALEDRQTVRSSTLTVRANRDKTVPWNIADRLRSQFEGINEERSELEAELSSEEQTNAKLDNLLGLLNANKYGFTRYILQHVETEQIINVLEDVQVGNVELSDIAGTTPLGFCGNHVILPLKKCRSGGKLGPLTIDTSRLKIGLFELGQVENVGDPKLVTDGLAGLYNFLKTFIPDAASQASTATDRKLISFCESLAEQVNPFVENADLSGRANNTGFIQLFFPPISASLGALRAFLGKPIISNSNDMGRLCDFYGSVRDALQGRMGELISSTELSLPTPAVFMEPVLSNAKGAELYDMRRNSHYEILPAPGIATANPNVLRGQDVTLTPNIPDANLAIQSPPDLPLPNSLAAALSEAGKLDLSTLLSSNTGTLNTTLSNLSNLATELAKASTQLTGDAQKQALAAASDVTKQIGDIIGKALQPPLVAPPAPKPKPEPEPPKGQQAKAEVARELVRINNYNISETKKQELKKTIGAPVVTDSSREYQMAILFRDENGTPYSRGEFTVGLTFLETGVNAQIDSGFKIPMANGIYNFEDSFLATKGSTAIIDIQADMGGTFITGTQDFIFPDKSSVVFVCTMKSTSTTVSTTDVRSAVEQAVQNSGIGATLSPMLDLFLNSGVAFPFRIFEISADGGGKTELDLKLEYNQASSGTTGTSTGSTTVTKYEVIIPTNGWEIQVR